MQVGTLSSLRIQSAQPPQALCLPTVLTTFRTELVPCEQPVNDRMDSAFSCEALPDMELLE